MKLGLVLFAASAYAGPEPCHEKSEKRLKKAVNAVGDWADTYCGRVKKNGDAKPKSKGTHVKNVTNSMMDKMLAHYTNRVEGTELCHADARSGQAEDE